MNKELPEQVVNNKGLSLEEMITISISKDKMSAILQFLPNSKEVQIKENELHTLIKSNEVKYGLLDEKIQSFFQNPNRHISQRIEIAKGKLPVNGENSYVEMVYEQKNEKKPKVKEDGSVDFYALIEISNVEKGQLLAKKIPATQGIDGVTVTDEIVKAKDGLDYPIKAGKNVVVDKISQAVYSLIDGQVSMTNDKINVFPVYEVNGDLDFGIGNIDFVGNVVIRGNIPAGFRVKSGGDIRVTGGVEGADLEAGGSIEINSGITAQHKGLIKAGKDIKTSFIVNGRLHAQGNVVVHQSIMHSEISAGENIVCNGPKGLIVGGTLQAGNSVVCRTIGNTMNTPTTIEIGTNPKISNRLKEIENELIENQTILMKSEQALKILDDALRQQGQLPAAKKELQIKLTNNKIETERKIKLLTVELKELELEQQEDQQASVEVHSIVYSGAKLTFGKYTKYIKDRQQRIKFVLEHGEIVSMPIY